MRGKKTILTIVAVCVVAASAHADVTIPDPGTYVIDQAGVIDGATEQRMEGWLRELEQKTTALVKVLTVTTTDGEAFFDFVQRHAELWKLGKKDKDNGVLIALTLTERKYRIHTGYGVEHILPDGWCGSLQRKVMKPQFKQGRFGQGLYNATVAIANKIADEANVTLSGIPNFRHRHRRVQPGGVACGGLAPIIILFIVISSVSRRRRHHGRWGGGGLLQGMLIGGMLGHLTGGGRSHWGGGSFGGGGFGGGFGGSFGGGGGFGGGGAGGSW